MDGNSSFVASLRDVSRQGHAEGAIYAIFFDFLFYHACEGAGHRLPHLNLAHRAFRHSHRRQHAKLDIPCRCTNALFQESPRPKFLIKYPRHFICPVGGEYDRQTIYIRDTSHQLDHIDAPFGLSLGELSAMCIRALDTEPARF